MLPITAACDTFEPARSLEDAIPQALGAFLTVFALFFAVFGLLFCVFERAYHPARLTHRRSNHR